MKRERLARNFYALHLVAVVSIAATNLLLALVAITAPWRPWAEARRRIARGTPLLVPAGLYLVLLGLSIAASQDPGRSLDATSDLFNFLTPVLALLLVRGRRQADTMVVAVSYLGVYLAVHGLVQYALGYDSLDLRIRGPFSHYMTYSGVLMLADALFLGRLAAGEPRYLPGLGRWGTWAAALLIQAALLLSFTRNAWIALVVVLLLVTLLRAPKRLLVALPLLLVVLLLAPVHVISRVGSIFDLEDPSNYDRLCMAEAGLKMVAERPFLGIGPGMVPERYPLYRHPTAPRPVVKHLHSIYLNVAAERGLPALAVLLWLIAAGTRRAWVRWRALSPGGRGEPPEAGLALGVILAVAAYLVMGVFEDFWTDTEAQRLILFVLALPFCLRETQPAELSEPSEVSSEGSSSPAGSA